jgi:protein-L-isoaspartate(D-aspartate) O-methyltransferase
MMVNWLEQARFNMVEQQIRPWDVANPRVLSLMETLPREAFVPESYQDLAYADIEIPLEHEQHMMYPRIEGRLMQALGLQISDKVLEVGTGSGYLTACLAKLAQKVVSIDLYQDFTQATDTRLKQQAINNVQLLTGDALKSPLPEAPFDAIAVTGSLPTREQADIFCQQLAVNGRLFVVIGTPPVMACFLITKTRQNEFHEESIFETELTPLKNTHTPVVFDF